MSGATHVTVRVPLAIRQRPGRKTLVMPTGEQVTPTALTSRADPAVVKALARAHRWQRMLDDGRCGSISEMAQAEGIERGYLGSVLRLTLLAPEIVQALLDGRAPSDLTLPRLLEPFPTSWAEQRVLFGGPGIPTEGRSRLYPATSSTTSPPSPSRLRRWGRVDEVEVELIAY
jgi:hypothetical protein